MDFDAAEDLLNPNSVTNTLYRRAFTSHDDLIFGDETSGLEHIFSDKHGADDAEDNDTEDEEVQTGLPDWFDQKPFQYNQRVMLVALPGLLFTLTMAGDLFLGIFTTGTLLACLFWGGGDKNRAFTVSIVTYICCQLCVLYSVFPLIWKSIYSLIFIMALNMHCALTGAWVMIQFKKFRYTNADLTRDVETMLFTLYPLSCIVQLTWLIASLTSVTVTPYCIMIIGFAILQIFLTPCLSSFVKQERAGGDVRMEDYVIEPNLVGTVAVCYVTAAPSLYIIIVLHTRFWEMVFLSVMLEWSFLMCISLFLATFLNIRLFMEVTGIDYRNLINSRRVVGISSIVLLGPWMKLKGFQSGFISWLPLLLAAFTVYGTLLKHRKNKVYCLLSGGVMLGIFVALFSCLPWNMEYLLPALNLHTDHACVLLLASALISVIVLYLSVYGDGGLFGFCFTLHSAVIIICVKMLQFSDLIPVVGVLALLIFNVYLITRFCSTGKLSWQHVWLCLALNLTMSVDLLDHMLTIKQSVINNCLASAALFILCLVLLKIFLFETKECLSSLKICLYMGLIVISVVMNYESVFKKTFILLFTEEPTFVHKLALTLFIVSIGAVRLVSMWQPEQKYVGHVGPVTLVTAVLMFCVHPSMQLSWAGVQEWMCLVSVWGLGMMLPLMSQTLALSVCAGILLLTFPLGTYICYWIWSTHLQWYYYFLYGVCTSINVLVLTLTWQKNFKNILSFISLYTTSMVLSLLLVLVDIILYNEVATYNQGIIAATANFLVIAISSKHMSLEKEMDLSQGEVLPRTNMLLLGNIATVSGYLLLLAHSPGTFWQCTSSWCLTLLQKPTFIRSYSEHSNVVAIIFGLTVTLYLKAMYGSLTWLSQSWIFIILCSLELFIIIATLPVMYVFLTVLWNDRFYIREKYVVFLTPLSSLLLLLGSTYEAWTLGLWVLSAGIWLMMYKLPLEPDTT